MKYSSGPFQGMSPSGAPGLLVVVVVVFGVAGLFVPRSLHPLLALLYLSAIITVFAVGLYLQLRQAGSPPAPSILGREQPPASSAPLNPVRSFVRSIVRVISAVAAILSVLLIAALTTTSLDFGRAGTGAHLLAC